MVTRWGHGSGNVEWGSHYPLPERAVDATRAGCTQGIEWSQGQRRPYVTKLAGRKSTGTGHVFAYERSHAVTGYHLSGGANSLATTLHHPLHPRASIASGSPTAWTASTHHMHMHTPAHNTHKHHGRGGREQSRLRVISPSRASKASSLSYCSPSRCRYAAVAHLLPP